MKAWKIGAEGPNIKEDKNDARFNSLGTFDKPLDVSDLKVPLADLKLLTMLLDDEEHEQVKSLTEEKVRELDKY